MFKRIIFLLMSLMSFQVSAEIECLDFFVDRGQKIENQYAQNFTVFQYQKTYLLKSAQSYLVTGEWRDLPKSCETHYSRELKILPLSTTVLHFFELLGLEKQVRAFAQKKYISSTAYEHTDDIGPSVDKEYLLSKGLNLIIGEPYFFQTSSSYSGLTKFGLRSLYLQDYLETHPLARAEWLLFFSYLDPETERILSAQKIFQKIVKDYLAVAEKASAREPKKVLVGTLLQGQWYAPKERSDFSLLLKDAQAQNLLLTQSGLVNLEEVIKTSQEADLWITQATWDDQVQALKDDERYALLFQQISKVYGLKHRNFEAYPFWEQGPARPDLVLSELVDLLHGNPKPSSRYFQRVHHGQ